MHFGAFRVQAERTAYSIQIYLCMRLCDPADPSNLSMGLIHTAPGGQRLRSDPGTLSGSKLSLTADPPPNLHPLFSRPPAPVEPGCGVFCGVGFLRSGISAGGSGARQLRPGGRWFQSGRPVLFVSHGGLDFLPGRLFGFSSLPFFTRMLAVYSYERWSLLPSRSAVVPYSDAGRSPLRTLIVHLSGR